MKGHFDEQVLGDRNLNDLQKQQVIEQAQDYWNKGNPLKTGLIIFERIPLEFRPIWAADILEFVYPHFTPIPEIAVGLEFARQPDQWPPSRSREAHRIFDEIRGQRLELNNIKAIEDRILELAEHMVGITYTARQYPAPFDHDRGWRIVKQLYHITTQIPLDEMKAWQTLANEDYILLDAPINCNPGCPICHPPRWEYFSD